VQPLKFFLVSKFFEMIAAQVNSKIGGYTHWVHLDGATNGEGKLTQQVFL